LRNTHTPSSELVVSSHNALVQSVLRTSDRHSPYEYPRLHWELEESGQLTGNLIDRSPRSRFTSSRQRDDESQLTTLETKRRSNVVGILPNPAAALRLVDAILIEQDDERSLAERHYFSRRVALRESSRSTHRAVNPLRVGFSPSAL
jgi:hypothetical protein